MDFVVRGSHRIEQHQNAHTHTHTLSHLIEIMQTKFWNGERYKKKELKEFHRVLLF